mmetsp:Transcript_228/g.511  ORF Transcript_228/g.511 Transcript_228/m.511 type:complete len:237 (+) Transcript_228:65-775(+)|eukprot:CAMPEP_0119087288 /NCGR_PEP_ID=MMETSP1178-20130426/141167_1 /TAXON_ID=33656 /ORGANISM="unid sp, Strain CCMP2000" /LENGTH=236 /DNA_ID=CAMNT_0007070489 /DNA_START=65 /DNA_END=775 /DNA_ORIENTATION=-
MPRSEGQREQAVSYEEVEVAVLGDPLHTARLTAMLTTAEPTRSAALGIKRTSEMMRTEDMWVTMTFIELSEAVLDPQLVHECPYGELPVCCVHELSASNPPESWGTVIRMMRRFAMPNAPRGTAPHSQSGGFDDERFPLGPVLLVLVTADTVSEEALHALFPPEARVLMQTHQIEPMLLSSTKAEAMVQVYWWAIQTYRRQHPEQQFTLASVQQLVRMILNRSPEGQPPTGWCSVS